MKDHSELLMRSFVGGINHHAQSGLMWNLVVDPQGNPKLPGATSCGKGCRGVAQVSADGAVQLNQERKHLSRLISSFFLKKPRDSHMFFVCWPRSLRHGARSESDPSERRKRPVWQTGRLRPLWRRRGCADRRRIRHRESERRRSESIQPRSDERVSIPFHHL